MMGPTLPGTPLPLRYIGLDERVRAEVSKACLERLGKWDPEKPRYLTLAEAAQLKDEDFEF